jgi:transposase
VIRFAYHNLNLKEMHMKYIGLDLHKRNIFATVLDGDGKILSRANVSSKREDISHYLRRLGSGDELSIAIEASYNWLYYYRILEDITDNITVAHPLKTKIIGEARIKTDKIDSEALAYMLKADMLPRIYIPTRISMENKMLLRSRISLVRLRTSIKNKVHAIIDRNRDSYTGLETKSDIFCKTGMFIIRDTEIPQPDYMIIKNYLDLIDELNKKIKNVEKEIDKRVTSDSDIELLKTIPGIGRFISFLLKSEIDSIDRFSSKEKLCSYAGLTPSVRQSGNKSYTGRITKQGNKFIRWALTEAAQVAIVHSSYFRYHYSKVKAKKGTNSAIVAVARRIAEISYVILKEKRPYIEKPIVYS